MIGDYTIQGQIPFGGGGNPLAGAQGGLSGLAEQYGQGYNSALAQNQAMYNNILGGYQKVMGNQVNAQQAIASGYGDLYNNVLGGIAGIGRSQSQSIADTYAQQSGALGQQLNNSGLGNTTIAAQMQRAPLLDEQKAQIALANQIAQLTAGYQSNLGMAGLNQANMSNMQNTALGNQQLNWMNTVTAQYPKASDYYGLYQQQGQWQQAQADRALQLKLAQMGRTSVAAPMGVGSGASGHSMDSNPLPPVGASPGGFGGGSGGFNMGAGLAGPNGVTGPGGYVQMNAAAAQYGSNPMQAAMAQYGNDAALQAGNDSWFGGGAAPWDSPAYLAPIGDPAADYYGDAVASDGGWF